MITEKLTALRTLMKERGLDAYFIPTSDFHETEYVGEHFKARQYMSGFTGSQGILIVGMETAALWTDGRYFIQAEKQLKDSTIVLMKQGEEGVPSIEEYLSEQLPTHGVLGFDGRVMNTALVENLAAALTEKEITFYSKEDLVGMIWQDRPALPVKQGFFLEEAYSGETTQDKIKTIREEMKAVHANVHIVTSLDDIAWILNMRGWDIAHFPVMLSYLWIGNNDGVLYVDERKPDEKIKANLSVNHIQIKSYDAIYEDVKTLDSEAIILLDKTSVNYAITQELSGHTIVNRPNPSQLHKAMKNKTELKNNRIAHIKDAVAMCKFMYWLKTRIGKETITEISASDYLEQLRKEQGCFDLSFDTIAAYKEHAAMMHYSASKETNAELKPEGMLLVDSGGQYLEGTTDITRTFVLGSISEDMRFHFTSALRSHIALAKAKFLYGCRGLNLDILARGPLWDLDIDYKCGTGHGVGHVLNVHEGPNGFRWRIVPERNDSCVLEEGMTQSNEPGVYVEGSHGIRHENEMVVCRGEKNEYGQFMYFETITFVPFDLDGIDAALLTQYERAWLNAYHQEVYEKVSLYLCEDELTWLKAATREIS